MFAQSVFPYVRVYDLIISTGSIATAFCEGYIPASMPMATDAVKENIKPGAEIKNGRLETAKMIILAVMPLVTPQIPPQKDIMDDSKINCNMMSFFFEPVALLIPISIFLSLTIRIIIDKMPIPPTIKDTAADILPRAVIISVICIFRFITSFKSITVKSFFLFYV